MTTTDHPKLTQAANRCPRGPDPGLALLTYGPER
jgi:hypothetical protein